MRFRRPPEPEEFYIGYQPKAGREYKKFIRLVIFALMVVSYFAVSFLVSNQRGFSNGKYDINQFTELEGTLMLEPFAAIKTFYGKDIYGNPIVKTIPLVNYGKFGADPILQNIEQQHKTDLPNLWVKIRGKLIFNHGVVLMELSEKEKSILTVSPISKEQQKSIAAPIIADMDSVTLTGQIIDPKCYFGVMKPGEGKPHSDCAIRCIAGGIQPLLMIKNQNGEETYFILRDEHLDPVNEKVIPYVGIPVTITGQLTKADDWFVLKINPENGIKEAE